MDNGKKLDRFRQLEGRRSGQPGGDPERARAASRFEVVLGPGEKAPPPPVPVLERNPSPESKAPLAPEAVAQAKAGASELEQLLLRELDRKPMHAGQQISLWRALLNHRTPQQEESRPALGANITIMLAVGLALLVFGSLLVHGPRLWQLLGMVGVGLLLVRRGA